MTTEIRRSRGRPRQFDLERAVATAQSLFHQHGYDAVSVADLTTALSINPPSFYAAFRSKAGLYARVLKRYHNGDGVPLAGLLRPDQPVADCLERVLKEAARAYSSTRDARGCLVVEGSRCGDEEAREIARNYRTATESALRAFIAERHPIEADVATDFVATLMIGLSARAREGQEVDRLLAIAATGGSALRAMLPTS